MRIKYFLITAVLATAILCSSPSAVFAASGLTSQQITSIVNLLQAFGADSSTIANVQAILSGTTPVNPITPSVAWCHTFNQNLGYAQSGSSEVGYLHTALDKEGISYSPDTGNIYGEATMSAVTQFQNKYASSVLAPYGLISGTGYVGVSTKTKLNALYGCGTVCTPNWTCGWGPCKWRSVADCYRF